MAEGKGRDPGPEKVAINSYWRGGPVEEPVRLLALSVIRQAVRDAAGIGVVSKKDVASARAFLASEAYMELCVALGVPVTLSKELQDRVLGRRSR